jgi:hypothetical protein
MPLLGSPLCWLNHDDGRLDVGDLCDWGWWRSRSLLAPFQDKRSAPTNTNTFRSVAFTTFISIGLPVSRERSSPYVILVNLLPISVRLSVSSDGKVCSILSNWVMNLATSALEYLPSNHPSRDS